MEIAVKWILVIAKADTKDPLIAGWVSPVHLSLFAHWFQANRVPSGFNSRSWLYLQCLAKEWVIAPDMVTVPAQTCALAKMDTKQSAVHKVETHSIVMHAISFWRNHVIKPIYYLTKEIKVWSKTLKERRGRKEWDKFYPPTLWDTKLNCACSLFRGRALFNTDWS